MTTKVDFVAVWQHYADHIRPVYDALPAEFRGQFVSDVTPGLGPLTVVASDRDRAACVMRPVVRMEHGIGMSYAGVDHGSWPGGRRQTNVVAFLAPNETCADRWREAYPRIRPEVVGVPRMDAWRRFGPTPRAERPVVCFSWHWDCTVSPEAGWAFPEYRQAVRRLARWRPDLEVVIHSHPLARPAIEKWAVAAGLRYLKSFDEVLATADVYAADTSSTIYEFAALDRPVILMNSGAYRRDVRHGIRFWDWSDVGVNVWSRRPRDLVAAVDEALEDDFAKARRRATVALFPHLGAATTRATRAIISLIE